MGLNLPGVGGGLLAAAGAIGGAGKGLAEVGEAQQKENLETKMQGLAQKREEAITRLQGQQQSGLEEQRAGHEKERVGEEIAGRSAVAHYETGEKEAEAGRQREFVGGQATQKQGSQERIAKGHDAARIAAAKSHVPAGKAPPPVWKTKTVNYGGTIDPVSHLPVGGKGVNVLQHTPSGQQFIPIGDKLMPYDGSKDNGLMFDPASIRRAPAQATQDLLSDPDGVTPSGNSKREVYLNRFHYLPGDLYKKAAQQPSAPAGDGGIGDQETAPENEDPSESEPDEQQ